MRTTLYDRDALSSELAPSAVGMLFFARGRLPQANQSPVSAGGAPKGSHEGRGALACLRAPYQRSSKQ